MIYVKMPDGNEFFGFAKQGYALLIPAARYDPSFFRPRHYLNAQTFFPWL